MEWVGFNTDLHKIVNLPTDLHNAGDFRIFQMPYCVGIVTEGCAALNPRLRATRSARAFVLSERFAAWLFKHGFTQEMVICPRIYTMLRC